MANLPTEWQHNNGNLNGLNERSAMNKKVHNTERGRTRSKLDNPNITIPQIKPIKTRAITKDFKDGIDDDFKTRSSQLTDSDFKNMPPLIRIKDCQITSHYIAGFTTSKNDLHLRHREFEKIHKKNEFGFDRTATKDIIVKKINAEDVVHRPEPKNRFNKVGFESRETGGKTPIVAIQQERTKLIIKH